MNVLASLLADEQIAMLPSEQDVAFYEEHGWYITPHQVIPDEVLDEAIYGTERFYRGERDAELPFSTGFSDWQPGQGDAIRNNQHVSYRNKQLRKLLLQPLVGAIAAKLARTPQVRLFEDTLVYKGPTQPDQVREGGAVGWHTDAAYSSNCTSQNMLSAWIPLYDITPERSPLVILDRSHKWTGTEHLRTFNQQNFQEIEKRFAYPDREMLEVPMIMKRGQVSFHHCLSVHGSYPNSSNSVRLAFALYLQDYENRYQPFWNQGQQIHHFLDKVCRSLPNGQPDYSDPEVFPAIWTDPSLC